MLRRGLPVFVMVSVFSIQAVCAQDFGIVLDFSGHSDLYRDSKPQRLDVGTELIVGDTIEISANGQVVFVSYKECEEVSVAGAGEVSIAGVEDIQTQQGQTWQIRQLPVCYQPESFSYSGPNITSGILLRGVSGNVQTEQEVARMRDSAANSSISNSELVSLMVYDIRNDNLDTARTYYKQLKQRNPDARLPAILLEQLGAE